MNFRVMRYDNITTILLVVVGVILVLYAQIKINITYAKYRKIRNIKGIRGIEVARTILDANGLSQIDIYETNGNLTDHYDPTKKLIKLSSEIYDGTSIASIAVAAHECGHAIQDKQDYSFFKIRSALVPIVNFISYLGYFGLIVSLFAGVTGYLKLSIVILFATALFQLVTLPVELDASKRAKEQLINLGLINTEEEHGIRKVLSAAAMTYIASLVSSILNLLRLILIFSSRERDD